MTGSLAAGLDLGTSGLKGVVLGDDGTVVARAAAPYPTARPQPGVAEQDPGDWFRAIEAVVRRLMVSCPAESLTGLGLTAMIPTLVLLDAAGDPVGPAITWEDARAEVDGAAVREAFGGDELYRRTGQWVDGRYLLPMFARLCRDDPGRAAAAVTITGAKDHLYQLLTGRLATDPSTAAGFGCFDLATGGWASDLVSVSLGPQAAASRPSLPAVEPTASSAPLTADASRRLGLPAGLPVWLGGADSVCAAFGLGVREPGGAALIAGTSTVILGFRPEPVWDERHRFLVTPGAGSAWGLEMDLVSTGSAVAWLAGLLGLDGGQERLLALAASATPGARGVSLLPFLGPGEQGALWDPSLRGSILGLTLSHEPGDLARALLEAITIETARCLDVLDQVGVSGEVSVSGWASADPLPRWLADVTGRTVRVGAGESEDASAVGAALIALGGVDKGPVPSMATGHVFEPVAGGGDGWEDVRRRHEAALVAMQTMEA
jgi:sugar (pentulose or hexulose) kinase